MKKLMALIVLAVFAMPSFAEQYYVADNLFTYVHSGPSAQYRIIGSVNAGDKIEVLQSNKETDYSEIVDDKGRKGWIQSKFITTNESISVRMPKLEEELAQLKAQLANAKDDANTEKEELVKTLELRTRQVSELDTNYSDIASKLNQAQTEIRQLRAKLDTQKEDLLMKYFVYGGGVMLGGLIFGIILPYLIPKRRRNNSDWV